MTFGSLKSGIRAIINRKDFTDAQAGGFVLRAVSEIERVCRIGPMEQLLSATAWDGSEHTISLPGNYVELIDIFTNNGGCLRQVDKDEFFATCNVGGVPSVFLTMGRTWHLKPYPAVGTEVFVHYYASTPPLAGDTDSNVWTSTAFNAVLYGAAALAADFFQMEDQYVQRFQGKCDALIERLQAQALSEKWAGPLNIGKPTGLGDY